ncbi:MAG TPA: phage portal protein [Novosphingobium sp.]|jgi:lambda family phage portal protein|nr:phage portal protein [Novosphingobium sp.]
MGALTTFRRRVGAWLGGFEGAAGHRRLRGFTPSRAHVNVLLAQAGREMGARARFLVRNNGYASNAAESWAANSVGDGIKPQSLIKSAKAKEKLHKLFLAWTDEADAEGLTDFYGIQRRISREMFIAGECFVRFRARRTEDGLTVPFQLQVLPSEMLPMEKNEDLGGGEIRQGIEFDALGRRVAYHFFRRHPADVAARATAVIGELVRVPADEVVHLVDAAEPGQIRGVSRFSAAIVKMFLLDQYDDAELDRKKVAALYALFVTSALGEDMVPPETGDGDGRSPVEEDMLQLSPGAILRLEPGEDVKPTDPAESGSTYEPFQYRTLLQVCAALGMPYAFVTGDINKANFSNARLMLMEFRRRVAAFQHSVLVFQFCRPVWQRFMDLAVLSGALALPSYERRRREYLACQWLPPRWDWVDPQKDINAEILQIEAGLKSRSLAISERGYDAEAMDEQIAEDRKREKKLGLTFARGANQPPPGSPAPAGETEDDDREERREAGPQEGEEE